MQVHKFDGRTDKTTKLFEAEYEGVKKGKVIFSGDGKYIDSIGQTTNLYRLDFTDQDELKDLIEDLIELYNSRVAEESSDG